MTHFLHVVRVVCLALASHSRLTASFAVLLVLMPQVDKAFEIDDPLFLWTAQNVVHDPHNLFSARCNWWNVTQPLSVVHNHPPGQSLYLALIGALAGWKETPLRLAMILPALLVVIGVLQLSRDLGHSQQAGLVAAVWVATCPGFVVCMSSVMAEPWLLACWVWAVRTWRKGIITNHVGLCWAGSALATVAACVKYPGINLVPLFIAFGWIAGIRRPAVFASCLLPVVLLAAVDALMRPSAGGSILNLVASYALSDSHYEGASRLVRAAMLPGFLGGTCVFVLPVCAPFARRAGSVAGISACMAAVLVAGWLSLGTAPWQHMSTFDGVTFLQWTFMTLVGCTVLWVSGTTIFRNRNKDLVLLALWIVGVAAFAGLVNWTLNMRSVLPAVPAIAVLFAGQLDQLSWFRRSPGHVAIAASVLTNALLGISVGLGDYAYAEADRRAAHLLSARDVTADHKIFFLGHWGFQWYMQQAGAIPVDVSDFCMEPLDVVVVPLGNTNLIPDMPPEDCATLRARLGISMHAWCAVMDGHAGFHAWEFGWLPYRLGRVQDQDYLVLEMTRRFVSRNKDDETTEEATPRGGRCQEARR